MGQIKNEFVIGITGHRKLPKDKIPIIRQSVDNFLAEAIEKHADSAITVLSSLAEGADMLCAKSALDLGLGIVVPLPMNATEYRRDFCRSAAGEFDYLLSMADDVFVAKPYELVPDNPSKGFYYRQAGIYVAKHCDVLLAVWDNVERDTQDGAGTWETVKLAREFGKSVVSVGY